MSPRRGRWACRHHQRSSVTAPKMSRPAAASWCRAIIARGTTRTRAGWMPRCSKTCSSGRSSLDVLGEAPVELGPAIAEKAERRAVLFRLREVESRDERARLIRAELGEHVAALVAD